MKIKIKAKPIKKEEIPIKTEFIKLDSLLKFAAVAETGGDAKLMVSEGEIKVNGEICTQRGKKIRPGDIVEGLGRVLVITQDTEA